MSNTLSVKVANRTSGGEEWYEGTVSISGLKPTKLARKSDGSTRFPTRSAVTGAARNLAKALGFSDVEVNDGSKAAAPKKAAAKKSVKSSSSTPSTATTTY